MQCLDFLSDLNWSSNVYIPWMWCFGLSYTLRLFDIWPYPLFWWMEVDCIIMTDILWNDLPIKVTPTDNMNPIQCPMSHLTHLLHIFDCTSYLTSDIVAQHHYVCECTCKRARNIFTLNMVKCVPLRNGSSETMVDDGALARYMVCKKIIQIDGPC